MKRPGIARKISIDDLLLDPNNPRIIHHPSERVSSKDVPKAEVQEAAYKAMLRFEIPSLAESIRTRGWYPVGVPIFVEAIKSQPDKFVVLEGNRRVTALKTLQRKLDKKDYPALFSDMRELECIDVTLSSDDEKENIRGMIHQSGTLAWSLLSQASDVYRLYMNFLGTHKDSSYVYKVEIAKKVVQSYDLRLGDVRDKLAAYRLFLSIYDKLGPGDDRTTLLEKKFSIISESVRSTAMRAYLQYDLDKGEMPSAKLELFIRLILGTEKKKDPIIKEASAGENNLRDFLFILTKSPKHIEEILDGGTNIADAKAKLKSSLEDNTSIHSLERAASIITRLRVADFEDGVTPTAKQYIKEIERVIAAVKKHY